MKRADAGGWPGRLLLGYLCYNLHDLVRYFHFARARLDRLQETMEGLQVQMALFLRRDVRSMQGGGGDEGGEGVYDAPPGCE
jgi:hypothetical protein